jgi:hypothetical protein
VPGCMPTFIGKKVTCQTPGTGTSGQESFKPAGRSRKSGRRSSVPCSTRSIHQDDEEIECLLLCSGRAECRSILLFLLSCFPLGPTRPLGGSNLFSRRCRHDSSPLKVLREVTANGRTQGRADGFESCRIQLLYFALVWSRSCFNCLTSLLRFTMSFPPGQKFYQPVLHHQYSRMLRFLKKLRS